MTNNLIAGDPAAIVERVILNGDLSKLSTAERIDYYCRLCESLGLNSLTQPFSYITLNGKLTLYALKGATDQLRKVYGVSLEKPTIDYQEDLVIVTITGRDKENRTDCDIGAVVIGHLKGEARANAIMKAITKAKRRLTLSLCGLGMLDESEVESIPSAQPFVEVAAAVSEPVTLITPAQSKRLHTLGEAVYGDRWDDERARLVKWATGGKQTSSKELTTKAAATLIEGLEEKAMEIAEKVDAQEAVPTLDPMELAV